MYVSGSNEDAETVTAFFEDMKMRGLNELLLITSDGAPGTIKAIEVCFRMLRASAAWRIACATWPAKFLRRYGWSSSVVQHDRGDLMGLTFLGPAAMAVHPPRCPLSPLRVNTYAASITMEPARGRG
jgi:hypothetical protein